MKVAVLIPCFNEMTTIEKVVQDFRACLPDAEIYVYDNNSTDGSHVLAEKAGALVRHEKRQGKGNVIRTMFREIEADCYVMVDGDDTYPADRAPRMVDLVLHHNVDMVVGDRLSTTYLEENNRKYHNFGNTFVRHIVNRLFRGNIKDIMTGYRAFSRDFVKSFPVISEGFEVETEMTIHALDKNMSVESVPVLYRNRPSGSVSKLNTFRDGFKVIFTIVKLYKDYKPLAFFSLIALIFLAISIWLFVPVIIEYLQTGLVPRFPSLITSGISFLAFLQSLTCGLILDTEVRRGRQYFELQMIMQKALYHQQTHQQEE